MRITYRNHVGAVTAALLVVACSDPATVTSHAGMHASVTASAAANADAAGLLKAVHSATSRFHSTVQATKAGYAEASPCVSVPGLGGMGFHWVNNALVDPGFDALNPEAVLYAPDKHGNYKLVAVEYIVINVGQPAPTFDGQPFDVGGTPVPVPHWSLHVWVHEPNPNGTFTPFNPNVSCNP